jgi:ribosomal protein S18 acetylase RimI-like enzyme
VSEQQTPVIVRAATADEFEAVADLVDAGFAAGPYGHLPVNAARRALQRDSAGRAASGALLVAVDASTGELLGTSSLLRAGTPASRLAVGEEAELRLLTVAPGARGRGVGELLVSATVDEARRWGASSVVLDTGDLNHSAQRLYERAGFRRVPEREKSYEGTGIGWSLVFEFALESATG